MSKKLCIPVFPAIKGKLLLSVIDFFTGAGTGWYRDAKYDKSLFRYMKDEER